MYDEYEEIIIRDNVIHFLPTRLNDTMNTFTREDAEKLWACTPCTMIRNIDKYNGSGQNPEEYIMTRVRHNPEIINFAGIPDDLRYKIKLKLNENLNPMQTSLAVINDRKLKFIVLERYSGNMHECETIEQAKQQVQRNIGENTEFIILEVKAIAGPKKPEVHWDSLEEEFVGVIE